MYADYPAATGAEKCFRAPFIKPLRPFPVINDTLYIPLHGSAHHPS